VLLKWCSKDICRLRCERLMCEMALLVLVQVEPPVLGTLNKKAVVNAPAPSTVFNNESHENNKIVELIAKPGICQFW